MSKRERAQAAIVGLLEDLQTSPPLQEADFESEALSADETATPLLSSSGIRYQLRTIPTQDCVLWPLANRMQAYITPSSCQELIESIQRVGQQIPALVRPVQRGGYEIICGARRFFACQHLGVPLLAAIVDFSDQEALLAMDAENRPRCDISAYERAIDYQRWIEAGIYASAVALQKAIGINRSLFSKIMSLAELPPAVIHAFQHPTELSLTRGYELARLCRVNPNVRKNLEKAAQALQQQSLSPNLVYRKLREACMDTPLPSRKQAAWVRGKKGQPLFMIQDHKSQQQVTFKAQLSPEKLHKIVDFLTATLDEDL